MLSDPIANMLTIIRNANQVYKPSISLDSSKLKLEIAKILKKEGYITDYKIIGDDKKPKLAIKLKYKGKTRVINNLKRISKPGLRVYVEASKMPKVLNGMGIAIVSTSKGIKTSKFAKLNNLGGEVLAYVW